MADGRKRGVYILSFSLGAVALPTGLIAVAHEGLLTGVVLVLAGMALLVQSLEYFWARALQPTLVDLTTTTQTSFGGRSVLNI